MRQRRKSRRPAALGSNESSYASQVRTIREISRVQDVIEPGGGRSAVTPASARKLMSGRATRIAPRWVVGFRGVPRLLTRRRR